MTKEIQCEILNVRDSVYCTDPAYRPEELSKNKVYTILELGGGPDEGAVLVRNDKGHEEWYMESRFSKYPYRYPIGAIAVFSEWAKAFTRKGHARISDYDGFGGYIVRVPDDGRIYVVSEDNILGTYGTDLGPIFHDAVAKKVQEQLANDPVNHPKHYTQGGIECIDALEAATTDLTGWEATLTWQTLKYLWRWKHKGNPLEDLAKARFYLDRLIQKVEEKQNDK